MRRVLCALLLVAALPASAHAAAHDPLTVNRGRLFDTRGRTVVLHGVNVVYKLAPYVPDFTRADARRLRGWGMNAIRLGVSWRALEPARATIETAYVARVRRLVRLAGSEGLWVLVDMHQDLWSERFGGNGAPDWATLDEGQAFVASPFPSATCSRRSGGRSRASGPTATGSAPSTCGPTPLWPPRSRARTRSSATTPSTSRRARNATVNRAAPLVTEFGATDKLDILRRVTDGSDAVGVGWLYWQYKTYNDPTTSAATEGGDAESIVTPGGAVKAAKVRVLARAYPQRIAGRSARWAYSPASGRFTLRWTATRSADTVVAVPRVAYPRGFSVRVHGVRVVRGAPLTLRGSGRASITITRR